jgi:hypothetical protein
LVDIEKSPPATGVSPDDACIGAWRPCHLIPQARADPLPSIPDPPLIDIEKSPSATEVSPDDKCVGAWRPCFLLNLLQTTEVK